MPLYACVPGIGSGFFARVCALSDQTRISSDPPPPPHNSRIVIPANASRSKGNGADNLLSAPFARSDYEVLRYKLINVVVVAIVDAVDVS
jgi:hypothetical protein